MPASVEEEFRFIMTCLKHTETKCKPDFQAVGDELGIKPGTCYHRHWSLLRKWGMTGTRAGKAPNGTVTASTPATPRAGAKRTLGNSKEANKKQNRVIPVTHDTDDDGGNDDADLEEMQPKKKTKCDNGTGAKAKRAKCPEKSDSDEDEDSSDEDDDEE